MALVRSDPSVRADLIRDRIAEIRRLTKKIADVEKLIARKVKESGIHPDRPARHRLCGRRQDRRRGRRSVKAPLQGRFSERVFSGAFVTHFFLPDTTAPVEVVDSVALNVCGFEKGSPGSAP
jgi:hypothetical protein